MGSRCVPFLPVQDAAAAARFYCHVLGFEVEWEHRYEAGFPLVVSVHRNGARVFLTEHPEGAAGTLVYVYVDAAGEIDAIHQRIQSAGAEIRQAPEWTPYGLYELRLRDPDGHELRFGAPK